MTDDKMERVWNRFKDIMEYSDEDLAKFKANPRFMSMFAVPSFRTHKIVFEVIQSHGCVCQHRVGQRIVLNGNAALLSEECPQQMCIGLVSQLPNIVFPIWERMVAGLDPNGVLINTIGCTDVGIDCGGWGRVVVKVHVEGPENK